MYIIKRDGRKVPFDRTKIENAILKAFYEVDKNLDEHVKLFFRVTNTFKDCTITAKCGDKVLMQKKKKIARKCKN